MTSRRDLYLIFFVFGVTQVAYLLTLDRGLPPLDSAEFIGAIAAHTAAHPPGYPLLVLLGRIFSWIPIGAPYARLNFLSAFAGGTAAVLVYLCSRVVGASPLGAAFGALLMAFGTVFWKYSTILEVFTLNAALSAAVLCTAALIVKSRVRRWFFLLCALAGLGACHLHTLALLLLPVLVAAVVAAKPTLDAAFVSGCAASFLAGFLPYVYVFVAAWSNGPSLTDLPRSLPQFVDFFFRRAYGTFSLSPFASGDSWGNFAAQLFQFAKIGFFSAWGAGALAISAGIYSLARKEHKSFRPWAAAILFYLLALFPFFLWLARAPDVPLFDQVLQKQFGGPLVAIAVLSGLGYSLIEKRLKKAVLVFWLAPLALVTHNFRALDRSHDVYTLKFARAALQTVEPNSILLSCYDTLTFGFFAVQEAEDFRKDVLLVDIPRLEGLSDAQKAELGLEPGMPKNEVLSKILSIRNRPVYFSFAALCQDQDYLGEIKKHLAPAGFVYRYLEITKADAWTDSYLKGVRALATWPEVFDPPPPFVLQDIGTQEVIGWVNDAYYNMGLSLAALHQPEKAERFYQLSRKLRQFTPLLTNSGN